MCPPQKKNGKSKCVGALIFYVKNESDNLVKKLGVSATGACEGYKSFGGAAV